MKTAILSLLTMLVTFSSILAQTTSNGHFCGTNFRASTPYHKAANLKTDFPKTFSTLYIPLTVNFIGVDNGSGYFEVDKFLDEMCKLNNDFEEYGFHFYLENIIHINSSAFYIMDPDTFLFEQPMSQFIEDHNTLNTLNVYLVKQAGGWSFATWDEIEEVDYSVYPPLNIYTQDQSVVIDKDHFSNPHILTHEIGHYFALWHTFWGDWDTFAVIGTPEVWEYEVIEPVTDTIYTVVPWLVDRVDGINCDISGDLICDTPPDYIGSFVCNANQLGNTEQIDPVGETFFSNGSYYMSYSNIACQDKFSPMQVDVMRSVAEGPRNYLLYDQTPPDIASVGDLLMIQPSDGEQVPIGGDNIVSFDWDMEGVDFYILDIGRKTPVVQYLLESNILLYESHFDFELPNPDWEYYWIVRGVNKYYPCEMWADASYFTVNPDPVMVGENTTPSLELYPNPSGDFIYLNFSANNLSDQIIEAEIIDLKGRSFGANRINNGKMDVSNLPSGLYMLKVLVGNQWHIAKFIKN